MEKLKDIKKLRGKDRKYLRGLAHSLTPVVIIGHEGLTDAIIKTVDKALNDHELIKIRFNKFKEEKKELSSKIESSTSSEMVGMIGNVAIFYRMNRDEKKRKIHIPE
ncbi:MAG: ribosome assembly RNA-binding protein YhbY [Proteobacteria bacterium]|nr:ribosome assembly RNA-binding protein YhbY [Pseudomonadota bacterium]